MLSRFKVICFAAISIVASLLVVGLVLEMTLRWLPVNEGLHAQAVNQKSPVLRYAPNRSSIYSKGWNFPIVNHVRVNNYGFVNPIDYDPKADTPLLAIVGDSYIEAAMVPQTRTAAAILAGNLGQKGRVYTFASSGSALSQYLAYAHFARETFHPDCLAVLLIGNDFDESLLKYKREPGYHYFQERPNEALALIRVDREVNPWKRLVAGSALAMYVVVNLEAPQAWARLKKVYQPYSIPSASYAGNVPARVDATRLADSQRAVDAFLDMLPAQAGLSPSRIILGMDGNRRAIYESRGESVTDDYFDVMRRYVMRVADAKGFDVIDMHQQFRTHFSAHGRRFDFPTDGHWNEVGHAVFAQAIQDSPAFKGCFAAN